MHNPVTSAEEQQNLSSFFERLPTKRKEECTNADFLSSAGDSAQGSGIPSHEDWPIIQQLPLQSKIRESFSIDQEKHDKNGETHDLMEQFRSFNPQNSSFGPSSSLSSNSQAPQKDTKKHQEKAQVAQLYEQIEAEVVYSNISSASLKNFASLVQKSYDHYVENLKKIFLRMKEYSKQQLEGIRLYINYLQIKMKQEIESLKAFDEIQSMFDSTQGQNLEKKYMGAYEDAFLDHFIKTNSVKKDKTNAFYRQIKNIYEKLLSLCTKISQKRIRKENFIQDTILSEIGLIKQEIMDIIRFRLLNTKQKSDFHYASSKIRSKNLLLVKDKYLQLKYLMRRERTYIDLMMDLKGKVINYMVSIFSKETLQIGRQIQQCLKTYANSHTRYCQQESDGSDSALHMSFVDQEQNERLSQNQLSELLISFLPHDARKDPSKLVKQRPYKINRIECVLNEISSILQQTIFTTTIQMDNDYIVFRNNALLRTTRSILQKQEDKIEYQPKQDPKQKQRSSISSSYMLNHETNVLVILTSNHKLHLQRQEYIYTIDPHEIKIARKGREVSLATRKKGINRILGHHSQLASLQFEDSQDVDLLMSKLALKTPCKQAP